MSKKSIHVPVLLLEHTYTEREREREREREKERELSLDFHGDWFRTLRTPKSTNAHVLYIKCSSICTQPVYIHPYT
jgi:hypothetical protein